jgi:hypothetical protein
MYKTFGFLFLLILSLSTARGIDISDTIFTYHQPNQSFFTFNVKRWMPRDTTLNLIQQYQPFFKNYTGSIFLGNNGLAGRLVVPNNVWDVGFIPENNVFEPYFFNDKNALYYDTKRPFTQIFYLQGLKKEQFLDVLHTQNINKQVNAGFRYRNNKSDGFFAHQNTAYNNISSFLVGRTKNKRLCYLATIYFNKLTAYENWGLPNDSLFKSIGFGNKSLLPVNNTTALNQRMLFGAYSKTFLGVNKILKDSSLNFMHRFFIEGSATHYTRNYIDASASNVFYKKLFYDSTFTLDSSVYNKTQFFAGIENNPEAESYSTKLWWSLKYGTEWFEIYNYHKNSTFINKKRKTLYTGGLQDINQLIKINLRTPDIALNRYQMEFEGQYVAQGYNKDERLVRFNNLYHLNTQQTSTILFNIHYTHKRPNYFEEQFLGNGVYFKTDTFRKVDKTNFTIAYQNKKCGINTGVSYWLVDNFIYFIYDSLLLPKQQTHTQSIVQGFLKYTIQYKQLNVLLDAQYIQSRFKEFRFPPILLKSSLFLQTSIFKKTSLSQVGFDVYYIGKTASIGYNPELSQFYVNNGNSLFNYPFIDFFWNLKITSFRMFFKIDHLNAGLNGNRYYVADRYPFYDRTFRIGIIWVFNY